jgi:cystathionine beta-lyase
VDISSLGCTSSEFASFARKNTGLFVTEGSHYGSCGEGFLRINIACPRSVLEDGLDRLKRSVELFRS